MPVQTQILTRRGTAASWTSTNPTLGAGEIGYETDTGRFKIGTGAAAWASLGYFNKDPLTTKGDLYTFSTTDDRLAVGANGESLVADSSASTGLRYNPPVGSLANPVINGGMDNWQRGTSISVTASSSPYTADRWQIVTGANQASTVSRQATGDTTNLPNIQYAARVQRNSGQTGTGAIAFVQSFETNNSVPFAGKAITVSFYARKGADYSAAGSSLGIDFISGTGTDQNRATAGYTGNANVFSNGATLTTSWQRFVFTGTVPATATELATYFIFNTTGTASTNDYFELTGVQIDVGTWTATTAPTFRRSGGTIQGELAACQRYYQASGLQSYYLTGTVNNTTDTLFAYQLIQTMRTSPTITLSSLSDFNLQPSAVAISAFNSVTSTANKWSFYTSSTGLTAGQSKTIFGATGNANIQFSAEL